MNLRSIVSSVVLIAISCAVTSCGSDRPTVTNTTQTSVGQQLTDLDEARQQGIISNSEYNRLKRAIIKNND
jgi:hypothetical protein